MAPDNTVFFENVRIIFRNFRGEGGQFNREGERNFGVIIPDTKTAEAMLQDGWNVKYLKPREDDEEGEELPWLPIKVAFDKGRPPSIFLVTQGGKKREQVKEDFVAELDWVDILNVDMSISPYSYNVNDKAGIAAYLRAMYITIEEDPLKAKYDALAEEE